MCVLGLKVENFVVEIEAILVSCFTGTINHCQGPTRHDQGIGPSCSLTELSENFSQ